MTEKWIGWTGGECPVHPETQVVVILNDGTLDGIDDVVLAESLNWFCNNGCLDIVAYAVIKERAREWWINLYPSRNQSDKGFVSLSPMRLQNEIHVLYETKDVADERASSHRLECVHVREVMD